MKYRIREKNELKPSGVEWLGDIPKNWVCSRLKYLAKIDTGSKDTQDNENEGIYPFFVRSKKIQLINTYSFDGEAILTPGDGDIAEIFHYVNCKFDFHQRVYIVCDFKNIVGRYLYYYMIVNFKREVKKLSAKTTVDSLRRPMFLNFPVAYNINEQQKIANFLDERSKIFNDAITKKEQLISKLELAKQALISEVVTGKLKVVEDNSKLKTIKREKNELKSSGIEWLGDIPNTWQAKRLKYIVEIISSNVDKKTYEGQDKVLLCNYVDVYKNDFITNTIDFMEATASESEIKRFSLKLGDILITKDSESPNDIAIPAYVNEKFEHVLCGYHLSILRNNTNKVYSKYLYRFFQLTGVRNYFETMAKGVTRYGLSLDAFKNIFVPIFDISEQKLISKYLDEKLIHFDNIMENTKQSIKKLKEAKEALISQAVTGKIEVLEEKAKASEYFQRRVLAAYFIDNMYDEVHFGRVKLQKMLYMAEAINNLDFKSDYKRHAMGPYDPKLIRSIESQLKKSKWFGSKERKEKNFKKVDYFPLERKEEYKRYLDDRYWKQENIDYILDLMKNMTTLQAEMVATVYSAYEDLLLKNKVSKENLLDEVWNHWHDNKRNVPQEKWEKAIAWLGEKQIIKL